MKIKIQKHTKVRRPESRYRIAIWDKNSHSETTYVGQPLVNDITRVPNRIKEKQKELDIAIRDYFISKSVTMPYQQLKPIKKLTFWQNLWQHRWWK